MNARVLVLGWMAAILIAGSVLATEPTSDPKSAGQAHGLILTRS